MRVWGPGLAYTGLHVPLPHRPPAAVGLLEEPRPVCVERPAQTPVEEPIALPPAIVCSIGPVTIGGHVGLGAQLARVYEAGAGGVLVTEVRLWLVRGRARAGELVPLHLLLTIAQHASYCYWMSRVWTYGPIKEATKRRTRKVHRMMYGCMTGTGHKNLCFSLFVWLK